MKELITTKLESSIDTRHESYKNTTIHMRIPNSLGLVQWILRQPPGNVPELWNEQAIIVTSFQIFISWFNRLLYSYDQVSSVWVNTPCAGRVFGLFHQKHPSFWRPAEKDDMSEHVINTGWQKYKRRNAYPFTTVTWMTWQLLPFLPPRWSSVWVKVSSKKSVKISNM